MNRHFVLDFDGTLIDTDAYWKWIVEQFLMLGVEGERVKATGEALFPLRYTVTQHATDLGLALDVVRDVSQRAYQFVQDHHAGLLFADVGTFFTRFEHADKRVLTFGDEDHQTTRVIASGLQPHVRGIHVATPEISKAALLAGFIGTSSAPLVFIDDDVEQLMQVHKADLPVNLIRMRRPGQRKSVVDHELDERAWQVIRSFDELE